LINDLHQKRETNIMSSSPYNSNYAYIQQILGSYFGYSLIIVSICPYFFEKLVHSKQNRRENMFIAIFLICIVFLSWIFLLIQVIAYQLRLNYLNQLEENSSIAQKEILMNYFITTGFSLYLTLVLCLLFFLIRSLRQKKRSN